MILGIQGKKRLVILVLVRTLASWQCGLVYIHKIVSGRKAISLATIATDVWLSYYSSNVVEKDMKIVARVCCVV